MKLIILLMILTLLVGTNVGEELKVIEPVIGLSLDFTREAVKKFNSNEVAENAERIANLLKKEGRNWKQLTEEENKMLEFWDPCRETIWDVPNSECCSWYCGGGPDKVTASSFLKSDGDINYKPGNAHDLNYKHAWVEGVPGYGIGEHLLYHFIQGSPRITTVIIANGYVKSRKIWESNSRVKILKMYYNGKPYAILHLEDIMAEQKFSIGTLGDGPSFHDEKEEEDKSKKGWTLKFEIIDVYKGKKYKDTAISELYFDGIDVHCLAKGTKVILANGSAKNIEGISKGDRVLTYDPEKNSFTSAYVKEVASASHKGLVRYSFENGSKIVATKAHPFFLTKKGWASLDPKKSGQYKGFQSINKIEIGDEFIIIGKQNNVLAVKLNNIEMLREPQETYTISKLNRSDNFITNGFVVGVEEFGDKLNNLVDVQSLNKDIHVKLMYSTEDNFLNKDVYGDLEISYLQKVAAVKLARAQEILTSLNPGYHLLVYDGLRPRDVQYKMWEIVKGTDKQQYVANPKRGSIHNYGCAVDLTITDDKGIVLDMGTSFDYFGLLAQPRYEEKFLKMGKLTAQHIKNRKLLRKVMTEAGFRGISIEWWHFNALHKAEVKSRYKIVDSLK